MPLASLAGYDNAGGILISAKQSFVRCKGQLVIVRTDPVTAHGTAPHNSATVAGCSATTRINGLGIARQGDAATCGHACTGTSHINIGH